MAQISTSAGGATAPNASVALAEFLAHVLTRQQLESFALPAKVIERAQDLGERAQIDALTPGEQHELEELLWVGDVLALAKLSAEVAQQGSSDPITSFKDA